MSSAPFIVSCEWLHQQIEAGIDKLIIADVSRYRSGKNAQEEYTRQHIPGAVFLDLFANVDLTPSKPWNLATPEQFECSVRAVGIDNDSLVILYSTTERFGYFLSARAWWMFKHFGHTNVSILDGGLDKWLSHGFAVSGEPTTVKVGNFTSRVEHDLLTFETMQSSLGNREHQVCDSRPTEKYRQGHLPSAINISADHLVDADKGVLKSVSEMEKVFCEAGIDLSRPVATYCNSGMSSCMLAMAAQMCGASDTCVYLSGFLDWSQHACPEEIVKENKQ